MDSQFATQGEWRVIYLMVAVFVAVCVMGFIAYPMDWQTRFYRWLKGSFNYHLNRKAILEELAVAKNLNEEWLSGVGALSLEIDTDRHRYRSPSAAHIRKCLGVIIDWAEQYQKPFTPMIPVDKVMAWKNRFPDRKN